MGCGGKTRREHRALLLRREEGRVIENFSILLALHYSHCGRERHTGERRVRRPNRLAQGNEAENESARERPCRLLNAHSQTGVEAERLSDAWAQRWLTSPLQRSNERRESFRRERHCALTDRPIICPRSPEFLTGSHFLWSTVALLHCEVRAHGGRCEGAPMKRSAGFELPLELRDTNFDEHTSVTSDLADIVRRFGDALA